jgi:ACT domain-containing protein
MELLLNTDNYSVAFSVFYTYKHFVVNFHHLPEFLIFTLHLT